MQAAIGPLAIRSEFFSKWAWDICVWASRPPNYRVGKPNTSSSQRSCSAISAEIRCMFSITNHGAASIRRSAIGDRNSTVGLGDTVIVVEHDLDVITASDYAIDMGPGAGEGGGSVVALGTPVEVSSSVRSRTASYLKRRLGLA